MKLVQADLHIHSVLSPCAAPEMTPAAIVAYAQARQLGMIAVCDHNAAANTAATQLVGSEEELCVLAGIEISTREEAHVLGLFPTAEAAMAVAGEVRRTLPDLSRPPKWMGPQSIVSAQGQVIGRERKMLAAASTLSLTHAVELIHEQGGLAIAAHVDRPSFSVTSQLGLFPDDLGWDAIELSGAGVAQGRAGEFANYGLPVLCSSDSHSLEEIGTASTALEVESPSFEELRLALKGRNGRRCSLA